MPSTPITTFAARYAVLPVDNVDTDQIIPARFLTTTERTGLGTLAFHDWRRRGDGTPNPDFPLNRGEALRAEVLVAGRNFGCGSSREHAVWALQGAGFRAVVSTEFADIFRGNALGNGLLPIQVEPAVVATLMSTPSERRHIQVDLRTQRLVLPDGDAVSFPIPPFARHCLVHGLDELDFLLEGTSSIADHEQQHPTRLSTIRRSA